MDSKQSVIEIKPGAVEKPVALPEEIEKKIASGEFDFEGLSAIDNSLHSIIAEKLINAGQCGSVAKYLNKFNRPNISKIVILLLESGKIKNRSKKIKQYSKLDKKIAIQLIDAGQGIFVSYYLDVFDDLDKKTIFLLIEHLISLESTLNIEKLPFFASKYIPQAIKVNEHFGNIDKMLDKAYKDFGEYLTFDIYDLYKKLDQGQIPKQAKELGVRHGDKTGMDELKIALRNLRRQLIDGIIDVNIILESELAKRWIMSITRYNYSEWGLHDTETFDQTLEIYNQVKKNAKPLSKEYKPSSKIKIAKIDKEKQVEFKYSEEFLARYATLLNSIKKARALIEEERPLDQIMDFIKEKKDKVLNKLVRKMANQTNPKAIENLKKRKKQLRSIELKDRSNLEKDFFILRSFKPEFDEELREIMFYFGFYSNPQQQRENLSEFDSQNPTLGQISWILNFVDHITNQETLKKYFKDKKAIKRFKDLLDTRALDQEISRWQNRKTKGTMPIEFVLSRNLLTEFSGHIGDSCWASKYESILESFPNIISLIIIQNPDDPKHERLVGSSLLIETVSKDDEPLLVIRGLNPQENVINQLDTKEFFNKLIKYLYLIAKRRGRKLAIVIDSRSGGAGTNRPVLFDYLVKLKKKLKPVELKSREDTEFNEHNICKACYLVE